MTNATAITENTQHRGLIVFTVLLVAILEVLDSTIVNVSLPAMMPSLGANQEEITWVLTAYVVASALVLPLTGFLTERIGQKQLLLINVSGFLISSMLCGAAESLHQMVIFRILQGGFGASLIPISQAIMRASFPKEELPKAMAIWGIGIMIAPVFGPTLGGIITDTLNWRWVFYINLPICLLGLFMILWIIPKTPKKTGKIDWLGIGVMFLGIGSLQIFLDQGNSKGWFDSNAIVCLALLAVVGIVYFIYRSLTHPTPAVKLKIFKDHNLSISTLAISGFAACFFSVVTIEPIMLQSIYGYTALLAGITVLPIGISSALSMAITPFLMKRISVKPILIFAVMCATASMMGMARFNLYASQSYIATCNILIGIAIGLFMSPLTTYSLMTINPKDIPEGAGLYSYGRMLGRSIGISLTSTLISREMKINWNQLGGHINLFNPALKQWLHSHHMTLQNPRAYGLLANTLYKQSSMIAFNDAYYVLSFIFLLLIPLVMLLKSVSFKKG